MTGFPPPQDKAVMFADGSFREFPQSRWAWSNIRQLVPTVGVWRGPGPATVLPRAERDLGGVKLTTMDGRPITFNQALAETYADGIAVLYRGRLVFERYFGALEPHQQHIAMSVTKSFTGVLAGMLIAEGRLDPHAPVTAYVPELKASAFADATVEQVMDMTTGLKYTEVYTDTNSDVWAMRRANGMAPPQPGAPRISLLEYLTTQQKQGEHGREFAYKTVNTDVLAWITRRITGNSLSTQLSTRIWQPMGARKTLTTPSTISASKVAGAVLTRHCAISSALAKSCAIAVTSMAAKCYLQASLTTSPAAVIRENSPRPATRHCRAGPTAVSGG